jgi:hypothetical protein
MIGDWANRLRKLPGCSLNTRQLTQPVRPEFNGMLQSPNPKSEI